MNCKNLRIHLAGLIVVAPLIWATSVAADVVALYKFEETSTANPAADSSGNGLHGVYEGNVGLGPGKFGQAAIFDGASDVRVADDLRLNVTDLTLEFWLKLDATNPAHQMPVTRGNNNPWTVQLNPVTELADPRALSWIVAGGGVAIPGVIPPDEWKHVAIVQQGQAYRVFLDGNPVGGGANAGIPRFELPGILIGKRGDGYFLRGSLDEVAVFKQRLTAEQILAHSTGPIVPGPGAPGLLAWWRFEEADTSQPAADSSGSNLHGAYKGAAALVDGRFGKGLQLDGSTAYVWIPGSPLMDSATLTIEFWVNISDASYATYGMPLARDLDNGRYNGNKPWTVQFNPAGDIAAFRTLRWIPDGHPTGFDAVESVSANTWHHIAITAEGEAAEIYVDGVLVVADTTRPLAASSGEPLLIGKRTDGYNLLGAVDDVALFNVALAPNQIRDHLNNGASPTPVAAVPELDIVEPPRDIATGLGATDAAVRVVAMALGGEASQITYQWQKNGENIAGATQSSYTLPTVVAGDQGTKYRCLISYPGLATVTSSDATVRLNWALRAPVFSNRTLYAGWNPAVLTDGNTTGSSGLAHGAAEIEPGFAYTFNLQTTIKLSELVIWARQDGCCPERLTNYRVSVHQDDNGAIGAEVWGADLRTDQSNPGSFNGAKDIVTAGLDAAGKFEGQWIQILSLDNPVPSFALQMVELQAFGELPPEIKLQLLQQPANALAGPWRRAQFAVEARVLNGDPNLIAYQWQRDGTDILGATASTYVQFPIVAADHNTKYRCRVAYPGLPVLVTDEATLRVDWALGAPVTANGPIYANRPLSLLTDGEETGVGGTIVHGDANLDPGFAYEVNLQIPVKIDQIVIWARQDGCCPERLTNYRVSVHTDDNGAIGNAVWSADLRTDGSNPGSFPGAIDTLTADLNPGGRFEGQWLRIMALDDPVPSYSLQMNEIEVFGNSDAPPPARLNLALGADATSNRPLYGGWSPLRLTDGSTALPLHGDAQIAPGFAYEIDLGLDALLDEIVIWARQDGCCPERLTKYRVTVHRDNQGSPGPAVWTADLHTDGTNPGSTPGSKDVLEAGLDPAGTFAGSWIRIQSLEDPVPSYALQILEVEAFGQVAPPLGPTLSLVRTATGLQLEWSAGVLEQANAVTGPWNDVPGATSPMAVTPEGAGRFYRARQ